MRMIFLAVFVVGLGLAGFAVNAAYGVFSDYRATLEDQQRAIVPTTTVFVVTRALVYGDRLAPEDVTPIRWPAAHVPFGAFTDLAEIFPEGEDGLRTVLRAMEVDEPLLAIKVTEPGEDAGIAARLEPGTRAFTLQIDVVAGVSGFLRPGDRVDVYWTGAGRTGDSVTRLLRSGLEIVALDQSATHEGGNPMIARTITFAAGPSDIAALTQAQASGRLTLALLGLNDGGVAGDIEVSRDQLLGAPTVPTSMPVAEARICTVRQRSGATVSTVEVPCLD